jgi:hypothetical protein
MNDPIIDEIRANREAIAEKCDYDVHKIFLYAKDRQRGRKTVDLQAGHERPTLQDPQKVAEPSPSYKTIKP